MTLYNPFRRILFFFLILGASFFIGKSTLAFSIINDNFDSYSTGLINGQGFWTYRTTNTATVSTSQHYSGTQAMYNTTGIPIVVYPSDQTNHTIDFKVRFNTGVATGTTIGNFWPEHGAGGSYISAVRAVAYGTNKFKINSHGGDGNFHTIGGNYDTGVWYNIRLDFDFILQHTVITIGTDAPVIQNWNATALTHLDRMAFGALVGYVDDVWIGTEYDVEMSYGTAEVIELPEANINTNIQVGAENFEYADTTFCYYDQADCQIKINYRYEDIGSMVLLLEDTATSVLQYIDLIENLSDSNQLTDYLTPVIRSSSTTDSYRIFVAPDTGSSTLYEFANVHWISYSEYQATANETKGIMGAFRNLFPLSIILQIKSLFDSWTDGTVTPVSYTFNDFIPANYTGITNTTPIVNRTILETNLNLWNDKIYPLLEMIVWFMGFIYLIFRLKSLFTSDQEPE